MCGLSRLDDASVMIEIDGAHGEGGGAILRQALGMAAYAGVPVRVVNIRAGRSRPGLAPQHVKAVEAVAALCGARVQGLELSSTQIEFEPGEVRPGVFSFDIGTAGSTTLLLQTLLLPCFTHPGEYEFRLTGGSDVPWSPPADYMKHVTLDALKAFGTGELNMHRRGYYPKGAGRILARVLSGPKPAEDALDFLQPVEIDAIKGISHAAAPLQERHVAERQADAADHLLSRLGCPVEIAVEYSNSACLGSGVTLWTESAKGARLGGAALGARDKPSDVVGREAAKSLMRSMSSGVAVDRYLADQLIPFIAVRGGSLLTSEVSSHVHSNIYVAERIIGTRFEVMGTIVSARP
jgi:RNA 3'-terminal phosphate cyclase (GTP)